MGADLRMHLGEGPHPHRSVTGVLAGVLCGRFGPGARVFALHLGPVATRASDVCGRIGEARVAVEATPARKRTRIWHALPSSPRCSLTGSYPASKTNTGPPPLQRA